MRASEYDRGTTYDAKVVKSERITPDETDEVRHIVLNVAATTFHFVEGQSVGVLVPGPHPFGNEDHFRLYSIASSRLGEEANMEEISLCVRRCFYIDDVSGERYPGIASNYLCDRGVGDTIKLTGPYGRAFQPPRDNTCNLLMIGIGTGIAPFRAFMKHIYEERKEWKGKVRLFYGARTGMDLLYMNSEKNDLSLYYDQVTFKAFETLTDKPHFNEEETVERGLQDNVAEVWELLQDQKTYVYVSGLYKLVEELDRTISGHIGDEAKWQELKQQMESEGRWSTLFYDDPHAN